MSIFYVSQFANECFDCSRFQIIPVCCPDVLFPCYFFANLVALRWDFRYWGSFRMLYHSIIVLDLHTDRVALVLVLGCVLNRFRVPLTAVQGKSEVFFYGIEGFSNFFENFQLKESFPPTQYQFPFLCCRNTINFTFAKLVCAKKSPTALNKKMMSISEDASSF